MRITNGTDGDLVFSLTSTGAQFIVRANSVEEFPFGENGGTAVVTTDLYGKFLVAPTMGNVDIEGFYTA